MALGAGVAGGFYFFFFFCLDLFFWQFVLGLF
jgi:hypothetical protein